MKRFKKIVIASLVSVSLLASSIVVAQGWGRQSSNRGQGYNQQASIAGPGRVLRNEMFDARIDILSSMSGQSTDVIKSKMQYKPVWAVIDEYKLDFKVFQAQMHEKAQDLVKQAVLDGKLTQDQGDAMLKRMEDGPHGPRLGMKNGGRGYGKGQGRGMNGKNFLN